ncbi:MAG: alpha/beta hydrolase [Flavisolibacter sp.]
MRTAITSLLLFFAAAVAAQPDFTTPKPDGPLGVGRRLLQWVDSSRKDPTGSTPYRTLPVWVWYPTEKDTTTAPQYPLPEQWRHEQGIYLDTEIGKGGSQFLQQLKVWAVPDAPVAPGRQQFPVLVFGPGHTWLPTDYSAIIEALVSNGYIVVGFAPTGFAGVTQLADGTMVKGSFSVQQQDIVFQDALFVTRQLGKLQKGWLKDRVDLGAVGIFGHSQGGAAATVVAAADTTIKAFVNLDGDLMDAALQVRPLQPALLLSNDERVGMLTATSKMDREGRERSEYRRHADWVRATDNARLSLRLRINDIRHLNFNDLSLVPPDQMSADKRKNKIGMVDGAATVQLIAAITRRFFDAFLKAGTFPSMADLEKTYPQVQAVLWKGLPYAPRQDADRQKTGR